MPVMIPSSELLSQWAAEELWDWRVRVLFAAVCVLAALAVLVVNVVWGRKAEGESDGRARRYTGRICVALLVIGVAEVSFFKEYVSAILLLGTAAAVGVIGLCLPRAGDVIGSASAEDDSKTGYSREPENA